MGPHSGGGAAPLIAGWVKLETYLVGEEAAQSLLYKRRWFELWGPVLVHFAERREGAQAGYPGDVIDLRGLTNTPQLSLKLVIAQQRIHILHTEDQAAWLAALRTALQQWRQTTAPMHASVLNAGAVPRPGGFRSAAPPLLSHPAVDRDVVACNGDAPPSPRLLSSLSSPPPTSPSLPAAAPASPPHSLNDLRFDTGAHGTDGETRPCSFGCVKQGWLRGMPVAARLVHGCFALPYPPHAHAKRRRRSRSPAGSASSASSASSEGASEAGSEAEPGAALDLSPVFHAAKQCRALNKVFCVLPSRNRHGEALGWVVSEYLPFPLMGKVGEPRARIHAAQVATAIETLQREALGPHGGVHPAKIRLDAQHNAVLTGTGVRSSYTAFRRRTGELRAYHEEPCDWWSLGAVLYYLVAGSPPQWYTKTKGGAEERVLVLPYASDACCAALTALLERDAKARVRSLRKLRKLAFFADVDFSFDAAVPPLSAGPEEFAVYELQGRQAPRRVLSPGRGRAVRQGRLQGLIDSPHSPEAGGARGRRVSPDRLRGEADGEAPPSPPHSPEGVGAYDAASLGAAQKRLMFSRRQPAAAVAAHDPGGLCRATLSSSERSVEQIAKALAIKRRNNVAHNPPLKHGSTPIDPRATVEARKAQQDAAKAKRASSSKRPAARVGTKTPAPKPKPKRGRSKPAPAGRVALPRDCAVDLLHSNFLDQPLGLEPHLNPAFAATSPQAKGRRPASVEPGRGRVVPDEARPHVDPHADYMHLPVPRAAPRGMRDLHDPRAAGARRPHRGSPSPRRPRAASPSQADGQVQSPPRHYVY